MASQISCVFVVSAIWDARSVMCSVKCMYDLPYEMQYELYSDMLKQLYCKSYSIAYFPKHKVKEWLHVQLKPSEFVEASCN